MKKIIVGMILCLGVQHLSAQEVYNSTGKPGHHAPVDRHKKTGFDVSRLIVGGGLGLSFGSYTDINVSPIIGYRITDHFSAGVGLGFQYVSAKDYYDIPNPSTGADAFYPYRSTVYYPSVWARYLMWGRFFVHTEFEYDFMKFRDYHYDANFNVQPYNINVNVPCLLVGPGYRFGGDRVSAVVMVLYDVLQQENSPYKNRIEPRLGVNIGF